jgi:hypothetical protein
MDRLPARGGAVSVRGTPLLAGRIGYVPLFLIALFSVWLHLGLYRYAFDDAYIHFRVAEHFVEQGAPYFNSGEAVMASSSPAWTLLLCLLFLVTGSSASAVAILNGVISALGALAYVVLSRELTRGELSRPCCWALALPFLSLIHFSSAGLMETPLALLVLGLGALLYARRRDEAFILLALAPFIRLELAAFFVLFFLHAFARRKSGGWRRIGFSLLGSAPFIVYELYYFRSLLPGTVGAKAVVYSMGLADVAEFLLQNLVAFAPPMVHSWGLATGLLLLALLTALTIACECRQRRFVREESEILYLLGAGGLLIAAVYILSKGLVFPWYVPLFAVPFTFALYAAAARTRLVAAYIGLLLIIGLPHVMTLGGSALAAAGHPSLYRYFAQNARALKYLETGERLYERFPEARLMSSEIGALGYTFRGRIIDGVGLVSPQALKHHPMKVPEERSFGFIGAIPPGFVEETEPELIVSLDIFIEELLRSEVMSRYRLVREPVYTDQDLLIARSPEIWWSRNLNILIRKDLLPRRTAPEGQ